MASEVNGTRPHRCSGSREPARKCEPPGGLYIHLARREMCRSCAPSVTRHPEYEPSCNRGHAESGATVQR